MKVFFIKSTHCDRQHIHNHIIFNSVPMSGKNKYRSTMPNYYNIREISDKLCRENSLSVIEEISGVRGKSYAEYTADKQGTSWKTQLRETIDFCIKKAKDWDEFLSLMQAENYEIKHGKHISFRAKNQKRFTRGKTLGSRYSEISIKKQLQGGVEFICTAPVTPTTITLLNDIENNVKAKQSAGLKHWLEMENLKMAAITINYLSDNGLMDYRALSAKHDEAKSKRDSAHSQIKAVEKRIKELNSVIKDLDTFRKTKPVVERLDKVVFKEKYRREHETEFILHGAAKQSLNASFSNKKYPLIKTLRAQISELYEEKKRLYPEYHAARDEFREIDVMKSNVDTIIGRTPQEIEREEHLKQKKKDELE